LLFLRYTIAALLSGFWLETFCLHRLFTEATNQGDPEREIGCSCLSHDRCCHAYIYRPKDRCCLDTHSAVDRSGMNPGISTLNSTELFCSYTASKLRIAWPKRLLCQNSFKPLGEKIPWPSQSQITLLGCKVCKWYLCVGCVYGYICGDAYPDLRFAHCAREQASYTRFRHLLHVAFQSIILHSLLYIFVCMRLCWYIS
jgi:hypothetical protein